ncbi:conjugal transfer protein TraL [Vibrio harveyi]|uniref:conjugal transfer protein TraL n=1 Tax=Vibrio harveyi TaxID=669 RepID=UPI002380C2C3|nr:conjugal transfer protein TraL [Vibrio harveyi]
MTHKLFMVAITAAFLLPAQTTYAASDDECAIWLCLPTGFPSGCSGAKSAFKKRIKNLKTPLPSFGSCLFSGELPLSAPTHNTDMTSKHGLAAYIPPRRVCVSWDTGKDWSRCSKTEVRPSQIIKDQSCHINHKQGTSSPKYCSHTISYVETFQDGEQYGETYYFDNAGNTYIEGSTER